MSFIINPGTGPVEDASYDEARANVMQLVEDAGLDGCAVGGPGDEHNGRYRFELIYKDRTCEIDMPGLSIDRVRYLGRADQNIWDFPRLYVDGSSWLWAYAIDMVHGHLTDELEES